MQKMEMEKRGNKTGKSEGKYEGGTRNNNNNKIKWDVNKEFLARDTH